MDLLLGELAQHAAAKKVIFIRFLADIRLS
jgi:hypothetical protein